MIDQRMTEEEILEANGEKSIIMKLSRDVCGLAPSVSQESVSMHLFKITTSLKSVTDGKF